MKWGFRPKNCFRRIIWHTLLSKGVLEFWGQIPKRRSGSLLLRGNFRVFFTMLPITPQGVKVNFYTPWCKSFHHSVKILLFEFGFTFFYTLKCNCEVNYYTQMCSFTLAGEKSFTDMCKVPNWLQSSILQKRILNISMTHCELTSQSLTKVKVVSWC